MSAERCGAFEVGCGKHRGEADRACEKTMALLHVVWVCQYWKSNG